MATVATNQTRPEADYPVSIDDPRMYLDREISLLKFQRRVLDEARDPDNRLLERAKFLSILYSNLDEFFMVRVAVLKQKADAHDAAVAEQLLRIGAEARKLFDDATETWRAVELELAEEGIELREFSGLDEQERALVEEYFQQVVYPVLTPLAFDTGRPFPHISNLSMNLAVAIRDQKAVVRFARVKIPDTLPGLIPVAVPGRDPAARQVFVWMEQIVMGNLEQLFPGLEIIHAHAFRVTRDAEVEVQEVESDDLLASMEEAVWERRFRKVVRLQVSRSIPEDLLKVLVANLEISPGDVYPMDGPLDLSRLRQLGSIERPDLKDASFAPRVPAEFLPHAEEDIFASLRKRDLLLHHPFESFQPVVEFLRRASVDPDVLAIKITLYRVGRNSPIVETLLEAIQNGKQVAVLVELKARFDEESNIEWARALEAAGVHVVYGLVGLKVHSKVALVVRREGNAIRRYMHLGTGNYNPVSSRIYTDLSLFTADPQIGADVTDVFNLVTGYSAKQDFNKLLVAPVTLRHKLEELIRAEIVYARRGESAHLIFKINALEDPAMIRLLYQASQAGVKLDLLVRGVCCLRPGVPGISDNIRVISIVGRFLEHSRIYYFRNGGQEKLYLGSADLMSRNLDHRIELLFPIESRALIARLRDEILGIYLADHANARRMGPDEQYHWDKAEGGLDCQQRFLAT